MAVLEEGRSCPACLSSLKLQHNENQPVLANNWYSKSQNKHIVP
jgi:hypothetical protein